MKALASIFLLILTTLGLTSYTTEPVQEPKQVATIEHVSSDTLTEDTTDPAPVPDPTLTWAEQILEAYGVSLPANTIVAVTPVLGCGPTQPNPFIGGCTYWATASTPTTIVISPELQYTRTGEWTLMHELNHAQGNMTDECAADQYARDITQIDIHAYDCAPSTPQPITQPTVATTQPTVATETVTQPTAQTPTIEQPITVDQPTTQPTVQPITEPAPPAPEVPSIPPYTDTACSEFEARAEDGTCVPLTYWDEQPTTPIIPPHAEPNPGLDPNHPIDCDNLKPGDAFAGIGLYCELDKK